MVSGLTIVNGYVDEDTLRWLEATAKQDEGEVESVVSEAIAAYLEQQYEAALLEAADLGAAAAAEKTSLSDLVALLQERYQGHGWRIDSERWDNYLGVGQFAYTAVWGEQHPTLRQIASHRT